MSKKSAVLIFALFLAMVLAVNTSLVFAEGDTELLKEKTAKLARMKKMLDSMKKAQAAISDTKDQDTMKTRAGVDQ